MKLKIGVIAAFLLIWEAVARTRIFSPHIFPTISGSVLWGAENYVRLSQAVWATLHILLLAMALATAVSLFLGGLASISGKFRNIIETFISLLGPLPSTSLLPFALLWFGLGSEPVLFVTFFGGLWMFTLSVVNGFTTTNRILMDVGRNYGLKGWSLVRHILIPSAFPSILTGFKTAWSVSWRTVVASELIFGAVGMGGGLGWIIYCQRFMLNPEGMMAALMCISMIGMLAENVLMRTIEEKTVVKWGMKV